MTTANTATAPERSARRGGAAVREWLTEPVELDGREATSVAEDTAADILRSLAATIQTATTDGRDAP